MGPGALWRGYTCIVSLIQQRQGSVPLNFFVSQLLKVGKQPLSLQLGYRYYADGPQGGPDWGLRFSVTFLFPKH